MTTSNTSNEMPVLEVRDMSVTFDMDRGRSHVLRSVDKDIYRNDVLGIVGESGSGKSMFASALLNAVVNPGQVTGDIIYHPDKDTSINILELPANELNQLRWEQISMVFQGAMSSFNPTLTIRGHFVETLKAHEVKPEQGMETAHQLLSDLYLNTERVLDAFPHELSGGMKQRALIALSLVLEPTVLVMDEPTAALDLLMQRSILDLLQAIREKYNLTIIFITHDLPLVAELADRIAVLYAFEFVEKGPVDEVLSNPAHPYTRAMLNATPNVSTPITEMAPIAGSSPDPVNLPTGCSYQDRCPIAKDTCRKYAPAFHDVTEDHSATCFYWPKSQSSITVNKRTREGKIK